MLAGWRYQRRNSLLAAELVSGATGVLLSRHDMSLFVASEPHAAKGCCSACSHDGVVNSVPTPNSKAWVRGIEVCRRCRGDGGGQLGKRHHSLGEFVDPARSETTRRQFISVISN